MATQSKEFFTKYELDQIAGKAATVLTDMFARKKQKTTDSVWHMRDFQLKPKGSRTPVDAVIRFLIHVDKAVFNYKFEVTAEGLPAVESEDLVGIIEKLGKIANPA